MHIRLELLGLVLLLLNLYAFAMYGLDKFKAEKGAWRIPEARLLWAAGLGGSVGALLGMVVFHHKTRKNKFRIGVPVILAVQVVVAAVLLYNGLLTIY